MRRRTFDLIMSAGGFVLTIVLLVAGVLLLWGHNFADDNVRSQLAEQQIFFPEKGSEALRDPEIGPYLSKYAGQQLTTGAQAEAYANHYIAVHLEDVAGGKTYSQVSTLSRQNPNSEELRNQVQTLFRGETLRGLLLNAYAFWKMGQIAFYAAIASFVTAGVMLLLSLLGLLHLRRVSPEEEIFGDRRMQVEAMAR